MKKQNGITLISLIITIIVMLILAGVALSMVMGDGSVIEQANTATEKTRSAEIKEAVELAVANNKAAVYSKQGMKTKTDIVSELYEQGMITSEQKTSLETSDIITIDGTTIDFSKIDEVANSVPKVTTLAGTKWKMNDTLTDYSFLGTFNYGEQTGWDEFPEGCIISNGNVSYEIWGLSITEAYGYNLFGAVQSISEPYVFSWYPENSLDFPTGWIYTDGESTEGFLNGSITDLDYFRSKIVTTEAPTITFSTESNSALENVELINWFYENGTMQ